MINARYKKVWRDMTLDWPKSVLLVLAISIGIFAVGTILGAYATLSREMARNYMGTTPASALIKVGNSLESFTTEGVRGIPGILKAERRAMITARMKVGDNWTPLLLFVIEDFNDIRVNTFSRLSGDWPPPTGSMLVEYTGLPVMKIKENENILVKTPFGSPGHLRISGIVHDPGLAPAWQEQEGYGYITLSTMEWLGETQGFDQLRILIKPDFDVKKSSEQVARWLEKKGYVVHEIQIPPAARHPHQTQMNAVLSMFIIFGFLTLVLSSILVAGSISSLMTKQIREIGVMKTIGASSLQVAMLYLMMISMYSFVAILIAVPLSRQTSIIFVSKIGTLLNLTIYDNSTSLWVFLVQISSGILLPVFSASWSVIQGSRITIYNALNNYGMDNNMVQKSGRIRFPFAHTQIFGDIFKLSLRNVFRRRTRLLMTLGLLATGGALFIMALNMSKAWQINLQKIYKYRFYDLEIQLSREVDVKAIIMQIQHIKGVKKVEPWKWSSAGFTQDSQYEIVRTWPDQGHGSFSIIGVPVPTKQVQFPVLGGHWLSADSGNSALKPGELPETVINHLARIQAPELKIGDSVVLSNDGLFSRWRVVGFVEDLGSQGTAYVDARYFPGRKDHKDLANIIRVSFSHRDSQSVESLTREIENILDKNAIPVKNIFSTLRLRNAIAEHMTVLISTLITMAILMAVIGLLGLMSSMSMNVFERTRELGVMQAIGATPKIIRRIISLEGLMIGIFSLSFAFILSLPLSYYAGRLIGTMAFRTPLPFAISTAALLTWSCLIIVGSFLATQLPARRAARMTVKEALAYE